MPADMDNLLCIRLRGTDEFACINLGKSQGQKIFESILGWQWRGDRAAVWPEAVCWYPSPAEQHYANASGCMKVKLFSTCCG